MKNIIVIFGLFLFALNLTAQTNSDNIDKNVVRNVILINTNPWEVLMSKNGDILAKLVNKPDFLKGVEKNWKQKEIIVESEIVKNADAPNEIEVVNEEEIPLSEFVRNSLPVEVSEVKELSFRTGSALLKSAQISFLNKLAFELNHNKSKFYKLFSFNSEPEENAFILSKRRLDAVLGYLRIKGVDIDNQIIIGSSVNGESNKIVFSEVD